MTPRKVIIGVNAFHADSAACILVNGQLVAAAEEERFRRIKHWAGFPTEAIRYCLSEARTGINDVDIIAINQDSRANLGRKISYTLLKRPDLKMVLDRVRNKSERAGAKEHIAAAFPMSTFSGEVLNIEHHLAHLSSAFHVSPFSDAVVVSVDGFGDFASAAWGVGHGTKIEVDEKVYFPHSLGIFYMAITQFIGFPHWGDEYKVMGLAPYGNGEKFLPKMRELVKLLPNGGYELGLDYFRHHKENVEAEWDGGAPNAGTMYSSKLEDLLGPARGKDESLEQHHKDIAKAAQMMYEEAFFHLLNTLHERYKLPNLALAGGCGMNSVANGKVLLRTPFRDLYVQSAAGDAGGAIGAAFSAWHQLGGTRGPHHDHAYWGPRFKNDQIQPLLTESSSELAAQKCTVELIQDEDQLCKITATAISNGDVVGWFQGRMEWGPRALGNRSILGDPRRADMKNILNLKIKRRESFRPFAPSVLRDSVNEWFEQNADVPFMMQVYQIREEKRPLIPAVAHVDGSGRLQTVLKHTNPRYHRLIEAFFELTKIPMVLNTSFNENEPVVCHPQEALNCFLRTKMDVLVLDSWFIRRSTDAAN